MLRSPAVSALLALGLLVTGATAQTTKSQPQSQSKSSSQPKIKPLEIAYGIPKARPKAKGALRLATYNAENLFDQKDDPSQSGEYDDIKEATSEARLKAVAKAIRELDADVLCLQEIESEECLEWFRDTYLKGMGYDYIASEDVSYYRGVEQSVLSRIPISDVEVFTGEDAVISDMESRRTDAEAKRLAGTWAKPDGKLPEKFQRSPLKVELKSKDGYELTVFVVHFKAGAFDHQRELEALQTEQFVEEMLKDNPDANIAVLGDYNAQPNAMSAKALRISDDGLVSAYDWRFDKQAARERYVTHASGRSIDFIVMSPGLAADAVDGSYFVLGTPHAGSDWDWRKADENPPPNGYASDHYPVAIEIMTATDKPASSFKRGTPAREEEDVAPTTRPAEAKPATNPATTPSDKPASKPATKPATKPAATAADAVGPRPVGEAPAADQKLAAELRAAGWTYILPEPKSKAAKWGNTDTRTTWFPGYWKNEKTNATSASQPKGDPSKGRGFVGDGQDKPKWRDGGSPGPVSWVEWLCATVGAEKK
ncbi:MAG: endonuclease/exonuclease/phosphatase family protein [bacterium]